MFSSSFSSSSIYETKRCNRTCGMMILRIMMMMMVMMMEDDDDATSRFATNSEYFLWQESSFTTRYKISGRLFTIRAR